MQPRKIIPGPELSKSGQSKCELYCIANPTFNLTHYIHVISSKNHDHKILDVMSSISWPNVFISSQWIVVHLKARSTWRAIPSDESDELVDLLNKKDGRIKKISCSSSAPLNGIGRVRADIQLMYHQWINMLISALSLIILIVVVCYLFILFSIDHSSGWTLLCAQ